ncbi:hypothetical protein G7K_1364-t1 [Saitoella complicata NRRL Y-17804]|uniref:Uncharacterized protein n=1 Tax=Saitoella complicata (strain BCRC 22490 / CBS 7301 / JCM 7358 / NBRC 10748 / NRRL Y-17804) TaxID=698492 RepID=A0A0E9NBH1_SAICN|nr:hypothetical protein G7K_1364-t1 [Saitoella complicata NRRL Y-17804]
MLSHFYSVFRYRRDPIALRCSSKEHASACSTSLFHSLFTLYPLPRRSCLSLSSSCSPITNLGRAISYP